MGVSLAGNFARPKLLGGLPTTDPLDPAVARWWRDKATEIYRLIPDFGGFLVKANSEGQPGPQDYGRTHADGANVLADAVLPHGGVVMWRAVAPVPARCTPPGSRTRPEIALPDCTLRRQALPSARNEAPRLHTSAPFPPSL